MSRSGPATVLCLLTAAGTPGGLLSRAAWQMLQDPRARVLAPADQAATASALVDQGIDVRSVDAAEAAPVLIETARDRDAQVVWLAGAHLDESLGEQLRQAGLAVEVLQGSWDAPGSAVLEAVAVMDRLRSPGGCPWDAQQTHDSLRPYLIEEAFEADEAIADGDPEHLREELGDVLFQVIFHARLAQESADAPFDLDDIARTLVEKLRRRHPHVFAGDEVTDATEVERRWELIKAQEKSDRDPTDLLAGIPAGLPLPLVIAKVRARLRRAGRADAYDAPLADLEAAALAEQRNRRADLVRLMRRD